MDLKQQILHYYRVDELSLREISRRTGTDRKAVTRLINAYELAVKENPKTGIEDFLTDRPKYKSRTYTPRVVRDAVAQEIDKWLKENDRRRNNGMRKQCLKCVTREEATIAYNNIKQYWEEQTTNPIPLHGSKMNGLVFSERIPAIRTSSLHQGGKININNLNDEQYNSQGNISSEEWERIARPLKEPYKVLEQVSKEKERIAVESFEPELVQAKFPAIAWQKYWTTPTEFLCCPSEISNNTIEEYFNNLVVGRDYNSTLYYGNNEPDFQKVVDKAYIDNNKTILVFSVTEAGMKPYALSKIYIIDDKIIHESMGTFFEENGALKQFTLAQGLEWTGGDCIDDYC